MRELTDSNTAVTAEEFGAIDELYSTGQAAILKQTWWDKISGSSQQALDNQYEQLTIELRNEGWHPGTTQFLRDFLSTVQEVPAEVPESLTQRIIAMYERRREQVGDTNVVDTAKKSGAWLADNLGGAFAWVKWIAIGGIILFVLVAVGRALSWVPRRE